MAASPGGRGRPAPPAPNWLNSHPKHLLILTSAGKPVFSLHDDFGSSGLALCALIRALASKSGDKLQTVTGSRGLVMVFEQRGELLLVASQYLLKDVNGVNSDGKSLETMMVLDEGESECVELLRAQLDMLYLHVIFHVTRPALDSLFRNNPSYDLAGLLGGTEVEIRNLVRSGESELALGLDAIPTLPLPPTLRTSLVKALDAARDNFAVFGFLIAKDGRLVAGVGPRMGKTRFGGMMAHTRNFLLLANFVRSNPQVASTQTWAPLCMPLFDDSGHFQVYGSSVSPGVSGRLFFLLLIADTSLVHFHEASTRCSSFADKMKTQLQTVEDQLAVEVSPDDLLGDTLRQQIKPSSRPLHVVLRVTNKDQQSSQFFETQKSSPLNPFPPTESNRGWHYLLKRYSTIRFKALEDPSCKLVYDARTRDAVLWYRESAGMDSELEILAQFPPLANQTQVSLVAGRLKAYAQKEHSRLFCFPTTM